MEQVELQTDTRKLVISVCLYVYQNHANDPIHVELTLTGRRSLLQANK